MRKVLFPIVALALLAGAVSSRVSFAVSWMQPTDPPGQTYQFDSLGEKELLLLPAWLGLAGPLPVTFNGYGPTTVISDPLDAAVDQDGLDTINTEIVDFRLVGQVAGFNAVIQAGFGETFFSGGLGLDYTRGQIQDLAGSPQDGNIDFPANSFFDVFFDIWVDLDNDTFVDLGEVLSNDIRNASGAADSSSYALRMSQPNLLAVPPTLYVDIYSSAGKVSALDPEIGTFQADVLPLPLDLYAILPDRQAVEPDVAYAQLTQADHIPVPEIDAASGLSALALLLGVLMLMGERFRRPETEQGLAA